MPALGCGLEGGPSAEVSRKGCDVRASAQKELNNIFVTTLRCPLQRRPPADFRWQGVDVCANFQKQLDHCSIAFACGALQFCCADGVALVDVCACG
jgi:hypothetical protein